jgi:hypothetical protein
MPGIKDLTWCAPFSTRTTLIPFQTITLPSESPVKISPVNANAQLETERISTIKGRPKMTSYNFRSFLTSFCCVFPRLLRALYCYHKILDPFSCPINERPFIRIMEPLFYNTFKILKKNILFKNIGVQELN